MLPEMQAAKEQFERAREIVSHAFGVPTGNAQGMIRLADPAAIDEIVACAAIKDPSAKRLAVKEALAGASRRREQQAAADAQQAVKQLECQAACRRVLEGGLGYTAEMAFAALAVLAAGELAQLAALDGRPVEPAAVQAIFNAASARLLAASETPSASDAERMLPELPAEAASPESPVVPAPKPADSPADVAPPAPGGVS